MELTKRTLRISKKKKKKTVSGYKNMKIIKKFKKNDPSFFPIYGIDFNKMIHKSKYSACLHV